MTARYRSKVNNWGACGTPTTVFGLKRHVTEQVDRVGELPRAPGESRAQPRLCVAARAAMGTARADRAAASGRPARADPRVRPELHRAGARQGHLAGERHRRDARARTAPARTVARAGCGRCRRRGQTGSTPRGCAQGAVAAAEPRTASRFHRHRAEFRRAGAGSGHRGRRTGRRDRQRRSGYRARRRRAAAAAPFRLDRRFARLSDAARRPRGAPRPRRGDRADRRHRRTGQALAA